MTKKEVTQKDPMVLLRERLELLLNKALSEGMTLDTYEAEMAGIMLSVAIPADFEYDDAILDQLQYEYTKRYTDSHSKLLSEFTDKELINVIASASEYLHNRVITKNYQPLLDSMKFLGYRKNVVDFLADGIARPTPETIVTSRKYIPGFTLEDEIEKLVKQYFHFDRPKGFGISFDGECDLVVMKHALMTGQVPNDWIEAIALGCFRATLTNTPASFLTPHENVEQSEIRITNIHMGGSRKLSFSTVYLLFINWVRLAKLTRRDTSSIHNVIVGRQITYGVIEDILATVELSVKRAVEHLFATAFHNVKAQKPNVSN